MKFIHCINKVIQLFRELALVTRFKLIGAPSSAGAFSPGQEKAPDLLRAAGFVNQLAAAGLHVEDGGNLPGFRYRNDPSNPRARNVQAVADNARRVADAVAKTLSENMAYILLGGDCTNGSGAIAGALRDRAAKTGIIYLDLHGDLNTPAAVQAGALDWMGTAHLLAERDTHQAFREFDGRSPVLHDQQIVLLGWGYEANTDWEREVIIRRGIKVVPLAQLKADPVAAARQALALLGVVDRLIVHFDVDIVDFADCPLCENYQHGVGCTLDQAMAALSVLAAQIAFSGVSVTELNPDHGEPELATLKRFSTAFAQAMAAG